MIRLGLRNLWRGKSRLALVTLLIGLLFFLFLSLLSLNRAMEGQTRLLRQGVDVTLQLRARGSMGHVNMVGNDRLLPHEALEKIQSIEHVLKVEPYLLAMNPTEGHNFAMHVGLPLDAAKRLESHGEAGNPRLIAGRDLTPEDQGKPVALMGQVYARWAGITPDHLPASFVVDPTRSNPVIFPLQRPKKELTIIGLYASGYVFGDQQLFTPIEILRDLYGFERGFSWFFVTVDAVESVAPVERRMRELLGAEADIISPKTAAELAAQVTKNLSQIGIALEWLTLGVMALVIFFVMLLSVRERAREIGTLKALGGSNSAITVQFLTESLGLCGLGCGMGLLLFQGLGRVVSGTLFSLGLSALTPAHYRTLFESLSIQHQVDLSILALSLLVCLGVTLGGGAYGLWQLIQLSPMEAMKHE